MTEWSSLFSQNENDNRWVKLIIKFKIILAGVKKNKIDEKARNNVAHFRKKTNKECDIPKVGFSYPSLVYLIFDDIIFFAL